VIEDVSSVVTNGLFDQRKANKYLSGRGAGKFDSFGRNVDPNLSNQSTFTSIPLSTLSPTIVLTLPVRSSRRFPTADTTGDGA
jgi:hypothetical protein